MSSQIAMLLVRASEEAHSEPLVPVWVVGLITFGILMALLLGLIAFGGGRDHS